MPGILPPPVFENRIINRSDNISWNDKQGHDTDILPLLNLIPLPAVPTTIANTWCCLSPWSDNGRLPAFWATENKKRTYAENEKPREQKKEDYLI